MPEYLAPGVFIEEVSLGPKPIEGVSTSTAAFVGIAEKGPLNTPTLITNPGDFTRVFGGFLANAYLAYAVDGFFRNGGKRCYVVRIATSSASSAYADFAARDGSSLLRVSASSPGAWGKSIYVRIMDASQGSTTLYESALAEDAMSTNNSFKPMSTRGLNLGDTVRLSDGVNETPALTVQSIKSDGTVETTTTLGRDFRKETARVLLEMAAGSGANLLSVLNTTGFSSGSLVALAQAGAETRYVRLTRILPSQKRLGWNGNLLKADGTTAASSAIRGSSLADIKRTKIEFTAGTGGIASGADFPKANLSGPVARIRVGDTLTFGAGKNAEIVRVTKVDTAAPNRISITPALANTYPANTPVAAITAPQSDLLTFTFTAATLPTTTTFDTRFRGFQIGDTLIFSGGPTTTDDTLNVSNVTDTTVTLSGTPTAGRASAVVQLKNNAAGAMVADPSGFQPGDIVAVTSGGTTILLNIANVDGNRLVFTANPQWTGGAVTTARFLARQWAATRLNTLEFRIYARYEQDQTVVEETFDRLSLDPDSDRYVTKDRVINKASTLIVVGDRRAPPIKAPTGFSQMPQPTPAPQSLNQGGDDGLNGLAAGDYTGMTTATGSRTGLVALDPVDEVSILCIPDAMISFGGGAGALVSDNVELVQLGMIEHCTRLKDRFAILDPIRDQTVQEVQAWRNDNLESKYAALYYPWIKVQDPIKAEDSPTRFVPPSGHIAGIYARTDNERGVHKAPANENLRGVTDLERLIDKGQQEILNPDGVNCIRKFPGQGTRVWGARTVSSDSEWKYVNVRRLFLFIEESLEEGTQWVVFEPNDERLWARVRQTVTNFLIRVWRDGALMGLAPEEAFFVKCDRTTMTQDDIDNGRLIILIGIAPVKPAEFVIIRIGQFPGGSAVEEL